MTGRTCQLCGKSLSRFSVGTGGDFCSREHRDQFRLRLGMDRLNEANKVASLMRRRENAKTLPAFRLASNCKTLSRSAPYLRVPLRQSSARPFPLLSVVKEQVRIPAGSGKLLTVSAAAAALQSGFRTMEPLESFTGSRLRPVLPGRSAKFPVQIRPAGIVALGAAGSTARKRPRETAALGWPHSLPLQLPAPSSRVYREPQRARRLINSADRGKELRISGGIGFQVPRPHLRRLSLDGPRLARLGSYDRARSMDTFARPQNTAVRLAVIQPAVRGLFGPQPPAKNGAVQFRWPSAIAPHLDAPRRISADPRASQVIWRASATAVPPEFRLPPAAAEFPSAPTASPTIAAPGPRGIASLQRVTLVAFQPKDTPFDHWPTALHGSLVSGMQFGLTPARKSEPATTTLEEHFDTGLQNWLGATDDWKVDVAGVRAGSLALYTPSLEVRDYVVEFLARIENRSVNWVFRAAGFSDYYQATLTVASGGGYEFQRQTVIGGEAEAPAGPAMAVASSGHSAKTAVTLRTRVTGDTFSVFLDGQVIDTWTDSRLVSGGIGFFGAPDDRARLYWVKLTPAGHNHKETSKQ